MQPTGLEAEPIQVDGDRMPEGHDEEGLDWEIGERELSLLDPATPAAGARLHGLGL